MCKILGLFVNTFAADDKSSFLSRDNLLEQIQMQLYQKQKTFSEFFLLFPKLTFNFEHFPKKDEPHSWCIFNLIAVT